MKDGIAWLEHATRTPLRRGVAIFLFLFPLLGNLVSRIAKHGWWLNDFDAVACGAHQLANGLSPYSIHPVCAGLRPAPFVYAPQVGQVFAPLVEGLGFAGARAAWLIVLIPALAFLGWYALFHALPRAPFLPRLMVVSAMAGSAAACGNIGLVLHAMVIVAALLIMRSRWPFIAAVAVAAMVKPMFLLYLAVLLLEDRPLWARLRTAAVAGIIGLGGVIAVIATAGSLGKQWHAVLDAIVIRQQPGIGLFSFTSLAGLSSTSPLTLAVYSLFALLMLAAGVMLAQGMDGRERLVLGIGLAQLLNPRLMDYDLPALAPAIVTIVMTARARGGRLAGWTTWAFVAVLAGGMLINILEINGIHRAPIAVFVFILIVLAVAADKARLIDHIAVITRRKGPARHLKSTVPGTEPEV